MHTLISKQKGDNDDELTTLQAQFVNERKSMMNEVHALETKCLDLHGLMDRAVREKRYISHAFLNIK